MSAKQVAAKPRTCDACKLHTDLDLFRVMRLCPRWGKARQGREACENFQPSTGAQS